MLKKLIQVIGIIISLALLAGAFSLPIFASPQTISSAILAANPYPNGQDDRIPALEEYLNDKDSPLADYADVFIAVADKYQLDWKLLPAIAGLESAFGKRYVQGTYNAYGWGGGYIHFNTWEDSIDTVSAALKSKYIDKGAVSANQIGRIYAPPNPAWGSLVTKIMSDIDKDYQSRKSLSLSL